MMSMTDSTEGRHSRPRYRRLRRTGSGSQPWSRRSRSCPIALNPLDPRTVDRQLGLRSGRRPLPPPQGNLG